MARYTNVVHHYLDEALLQRGTWPGNSGHFPASHDATVIGGPGRRVRDCFPIRLEEVGDTRHGEQRPSRGASSSAATSFLDHHDAPGTRLSASSSRNWRAPSYRSAGEVGARGEVSAASKTCFHDVSAATGTQVRNIPQRRRRDARLSATPWPAPRTAFQAGEQTTTTADTTSSTTGTAPPANGAAPATTAATGAGTTAAAGPTYAPVAQQNSTLPAIDYRSTGIGFVGGIVFYMFMCRSKGHDSDSDASTSS